MELDWRGRIILRKLEEGCTTRESAAAAGITRQAVLKRQNASPAFAQAVAAAREAGKVRCLATDPPYNTGNRDFLCNDRFIDKDDIWRHSKWLEFMFQAWKLGEFRSAEGAQFT